MSDHGDPTIFDETPETLKDALADFVRLIESYSRSFTYDESHHLENLKAFHQTDDGAFDLAYRLSDRICIAYKQFINGRRIRDYPCQDFERVVHRAADRPGRTVHLLQRRRNTLDEGDGALRGRRRVLASDFLDFGDRLLHPLHRQPG